ncbi:MAG TPA: hypothetical protein VMK12_29935 [Anaeromyxobacteraceae bacterium]|nr:hypothetical protein [Anaeromyxobacteraceae bacterium]
MLLLVTAAAVVGAFAHLRWKERRIVAISIERAQALVRSDTWLGYTEAAALLGIKAAKSDPVEAGALRAFALSMLWADYRDRAAASRANDALVEPLRAKNVPADAQLAVAAISLGHARAGDALAYASRAGETGLAKVLAARVALMAGNSTLAAEAVDQALAIEPDLPPALALQGDLLRRGGHAEKARQAYLHALSSSERELEVGFSGSSTRARASAPNPRATFGLAKLALSRALPPDQATAPLGKLLDDRTGSPQVERARAALFLSALQARAGDRQGASESIDKAGLDAALRGWLEKASSQLEVERGSYRVPDGTPDVLVSASDDDPYVPPPPPPPKAEESPRHVIYGFRIQPLTKGTKAGTHSRHKKTTRSAGRSSR